MTILPKKKQNKQSTSNDREDDRENDHTNERYGYAHLSTPNPPASGQLSPSHRSWSSRSEDKRTLPDSDLSDHATIATSHSKRRSRTIRDRDVNLSRNMSKSTLITASNPLDMIAPKVEIDIATDKLTDANQTTQRDAESESGEASGYNSGDEYQPSQVEGEVNWEEKERMFEWMMRKKGLEIKLMGEDGACLFRAVADQIYGDQEMHGCVRRLCMDYMEKNRDYFSQYVTEDFKDYIERKRSENIHGNHIEIQAMSELYNRPIQVYHYSNEPINIFQGSNENENEPIRLSYHRNTHYNSIVDPYKATIGVGLGLPAFKPGLVESSLMEKAKRISEQHVLEQAMLEDKIRATDWEATNEAIHEQIARESYMEWLRENEKRTKKKASQPTSTLTKYNEDEPANSASCNVSPRSLKSPSSHGLSSPRRSPSSSTSSSLSSSKMEKMCKQSCDTSVLAKSNVQSASLFTPVQSSVIGFSDWGDDDDLLEQVLAQSQAEYMESLKKNKPSSPKATTSGTQAKPSSSSSLTSSSSSPSSSSSSGFPKNDYQLPGPSSSSN